MRGFLDFLIVLIAIVMIIVTASVVSPQVFTSPLTDTDTTLSTPQEAPVEPPVLVVDSIKFCQEVGVDGCSTHSTSFTNVRRVYATVAYSQAQVGEYYAFVWVKKAGTNEIELAGDGEGISEESGSFTTSLTGTNEDLPLSAGTYVFKIVDEDDSVLDAAQFVVN
jgi:hypothetical protein